MGALPLLSVVGGNDSMSIPSPIPSPSEPPMEARARRKFQRAGLNHSSGLYLYLWAHCRCPLLSVVGAGRTQCQSRARSRARARATYGGEDEATILKSWAKSQFRTVRWLATGVGPGVLNSFTELRWVLFNGAPLASRLLDCCMALLFF